MSEKLTTKDVFFITVGGFAALGHFAVKKVTKEIHQMGKDAVVIAKDIKKSMK